MNKRSNFDKSWIKYENFLKFSFHRAQKNLHFVKLGLRKSRWKMPTPPKKGKIPEFWAFSHIFFSSFHDCNDHKRLPQTIGARFYQMDHIWWAPHMHKKLSGPKMESQLRNTFGQSLISTLYVQTLFFLLFGSDRSSGSHFVRRSPPRSVCLVKVCLEHTHTILIF